METGSSKSTEDTVGTKPLSDAFGDSARSQADGINLADVSSEFPDTSVAAAADQQPPGKLKKTFKLFNVRKGICTLPNFFGKKDHGKVSSKKVISKSKTHDGVIDVGHCDGRKESIGFNVHRGKDLAHAKTLSSSQSAHSDIDTNAKLDFQKGSSSLQESLECLDKKLNADKSSSFPRPRKGLRGLFSSIRRHKKNKTVVQRAEYEFPTDNDLAAVALHAEQVNTQHGKESRLEKNLHGDCSSEISQTVLTDTSIDKTDVKRINVPESLSDKTLASNFNKITSKETVLAKETRGNCKESSLGGKADGAVLYRNSEFSSMPDIVNTDCIDSDPPSVHSSDQVSLVFDVTSLKSFDSLTGCGDIIADQDDDSIAESTVSAERSKNAAKRSSCLVTYQGGGEEMATPDEVDEEYLHELWEDAAAADCYYEAETLQSGMGNPELQQSSNELVFGLHAEVSCPGLTRAVTENVDLLTPQSDQQVSAPNSDEGYYDSNTPGAVDEGGDGFNQTKKDRLPRDSYSGDALYELYEPDDSLMSPPFEDSLVNKMPSSDTIEAFFNFSEPADKIAHFFSQKVGVMETEEERLAVIQQQLLCWELKRMNVSTSKALDLLDKAKRAIEKQNFECNSRIGLTNLFGKMQQDCIAGEQATLQTLNRTAELNNGASPSRTDKQNWASCLDGNGGQASCESFSCEHLNTGTACNSDVVDTEFDLTSNNFSQQTKDHFEYRKIPSSGNTNVTKNSEKGLENGVSGDQEKFRGECEQAVSFSQALVEFTNIETRFPNLSESLDSSDSGSFTQNLPPLPAMVTFDVVDVENEGECDQQIEMSTADEIAASFEAFDDSYVQKESFAEYDERMFHVHAHSSFLSNSWGVTSLPRHLNLYRMDSSVPAPLSLNRRSRSLDTDSLEFELSNMPLSKGCIPSLELHRAEWGTRKVSTVHQSADCKNSSQSVYSETKETMDIKNYVWSEQATCDILVDGKRRNNVNISSSVLEDRWQHSQTEKSTLPFTSLEHRHPKQTFPKGSWDIESCNSMPNTLRQMERPSHLPLQTDGYRSREGAGLYRGSRESTNKKLAFVPPLEERNGTSFLPRPAAILCSDKPAKCKPIGVTQGVPQFHASSTESLKLSNQSADQYSSTSRSPCKGRNEHGVALPVGCGKHCKVDL